ncbi:hypothetical protein [uncultured Hoeflea sp.]|uniref:hypothetical protein n=1 Tax=uncultured Hoeflea sp. TaxID=538666 RepID=UPI0030DD9733|tara:strand:+ start:2086 stop:2373 length:288 start_codon:yes stop_codon:yes gene_type:complete
MKRALTRQLAFGIGFVTVAWLFTPPAFAGQDCECLGNGKRVKEGSVICLQIGSSQRYLARCERNLNNTSWKKITDGCPVSQLSPWTAKKAALIQG